MNDWLARINLHYTMVIVKYILIEVRIVFAEGIRV